MRRKNPAAKSAKKSGGPKIKTREKSVLRKTDPNNLSWRLHSSEAGNGELDYAGSGLPQAPFQRTISTPVKAG